MRFSTVKLLGFLAYFSSINAKRSLGLFNPCNQPFICGYGRCESENLKDFTCICPPGLSGRFCEINEKPNCNSFGSSSPCQNGGLCYNTFDRFICHCPQGFYGVVCQFSDPEVPENWGIPSVEDSTLELDETDREKGWRLVDEDIIVVTKISTSDELKAQLEGLFEEIRNYTEVQLKFVTYGNGTEFIHSKDCVDDGPRCEWTANLYAMVPEDSTITSSKYIAQLLMDPIFPSHLRPEELSVDDHSDRGKPKKETTWTVVTTIVILALFALGVFGGLLYTGRGRPFDYRSVKKNNIMSFEQRQASPHLQGVITYHRYLEEKLKFLYQGYRLIPQDIQFVKSYRSTEGENALHILARIQPFRVETLRVAETLLSMEVDLNSVDNQGRTPMLTAATSGNNQLTMFFLDKGADMFYQIPKTGFTVLTTAIHAKNTGLAVRVLQLPQASRLLHIPTNPPYPHSPLTLAASLGLSDVIRVILDIKDKDVRLDGIIGKDMVKVDYTSLHYAAMAGSTVCAKMILDCEAKEGKKSKKYVMLINRQDYQGRTPLLLAVQNQWFNMAKFLLEAGSDPNHTDLLRQTAYTIVDKTQDARLMQEFDQLCLNFGFSRTEMPNGRKRIYKPSVQPDLQPTKKQARPMIENRRESTESGIASADSSFNSHHSPAFQAPAQSHMAQPSNWYPQSHGYDANQCVGGLGMPYGCSTFMNNVPTNLEQSNWSLGSTTMGQNGPITNQMYPQGYNPSTSSFLIPQQLQRNANMNANINSQVHANIGTSIPSRPTSNLIATMGSQVNVNNNATNNANINSESYANIVTSIPSQPESNINATMGSQLNLNYNATINPNIASRPSSNMNGTMGSQFNLNLNATINPCIPSQFHANTAHVNPSQPDPNMNAILSSCFNPVYNATINPNIPNQLDCNPNISSCLNTNYNATINSNIFSQPNANINPTLNCPIQPLSVPNLPYNSPTLAPSLSVPNLTNFVQPQLSQQAYHNSTFSVNIQPDNQMNPIDVQYNQMGTQMNFHDWTRSYH